MSYPAPPRPEQPHPADTEAFARRLAAAEEFMIEPLRRGTLPTLQPGAAIAARLGVDVPDLGYPSITVVGSKGKGTTAIACSAALATAGLCVGTVTSPSLLSPRERIRIDGKLVDPDTYIEVAEQLMDIYTDLRATHPDWVLPGLGGRSLLGSLRVFADARVDVAVFEASMGGRTDLTRIVGSEIVVITEVFGEHLGSLGDTVSEIALEKLGAVTDRTRVLVTVEQSPEVLDAWDASGLLEGVDVVVVGRGPFGHHAQPLIDRNLELGRVAAHYWRVEFDETPGPVTLPAGLQLPGRCQPVPGQTMVDCAISGPGAQAALTEYRNVFGTDPDHVYVMMPNTKDDTGVLDVLTRAGVPYTSLDMPNLAPKLRPNADLWPHPLVDVDDVDDHLATGRRLLAFGTVSFAAAVLAARGVDVDTLW